MTQYVLAPLVVKRTAAVPLVVGNFFDARKMSEIIQNENLVPIREFGQGVVLLKGKGE